MVDRNWGWNFLAECATRYRKAEAKFTNEQLQYLRQYYMTNKFARPNELLAIAKQWNIDDFDFFLDLEDWFFGRRMAEEEAAQRREEARKAAA